MLAPDLRRRLKPVVFSFQLRHAAHLTLTCRLSEASGTGIASTNVRGAGKTMIAIILETSQILDMLLRRKHVVMLQ